MGPHVLTRQGRKEGPGTPARGGLSKAKVVTTQSRTRRLVKKLARRAVAGKLTSLKTPKKVPNLIPTVKNASKTATPKVSQKSTEIVKATSPERKKELKRSETKTTSLEKKVVAKQSDGKVPTTEKKRDISDIRKSTSLERKKETETKTTKTTTTPVVKKITVTKSENLKDGSDQIPTEKKTRKNPHKSIKTNASKSDSKNPDHVAGSKVGQNRKIVEDNPSAENRLKDASAESSTNGKASEVQPTNLPKSTGDRTDANHQSKTMKDRARSPQKRKRLNPLRSSSAPMPTSENTKTGADEEQSKIISVARASKLSSEIIAPPHNSKKVGVAKKGNKLLDTSKCNKTKEIDPTIATLKSDDQPPIKGPSNVQTVNPSVWSDNQKCTVNEKDSGIILKMPFLDSQLVAPLGRKKLIGKVKPIARVKGTVIESKKPEMEKKNITISNEISNAGDSNTTLPEAETPDKLNNESDKKKCTAFPSKPIEDVKKSIDPSKAVKCLKKSEVGKAKESTCGKSVIPESSPISDNVTSPKITPKLKAKNATKFIKKRPKISLVKGRPIVKKTKNLPAVKGVKLAKKLFKVSQSVSKNDESIKDSASSSDEVTYSFPESATEPTETEKSDKTPSLESKSAILKKPKLVKSLPKKIQLVKSSKKPDKALYKSIKSADPCPSEIKVDSEKSDLKSIEVLENIDDLKVVYKCEDENIAKMNIVNDIPAPQPNISQEALESAVEVVAPIDATESTVKASLNECPILPMQDPVQSVVAKKSIPEKKRESYASTDDNSEDEERFAFPKIKKEIKNTSAASTPPGQKKKIFKPSPKPVKKFISIPTDDNKRRMRLLGFWTGPKKHREASLNAQAKVQCLYENESRTHLELGLMRTIDRVPPKWKEAVKKKSIKTEKRNSTSSESEYEKKVKFENTSSEDESNAPTRTLRYQPTGSGKYWEMKLSSSEESEAEHRRQAPEKKKYTIKPKVVVKSEKVTESSDVVKVKKPKPAPPPKKKRVRAEVVMDLRDMVVKKRMASLNATAMLHASYEKRSPKSSKEGTTSDSQTSSEEERLAKRSRSYLADRAECSTSRKDFTSGVTEVTAATKKMAVIVNQEADVTITGVYSTHTGYCTVSEMQYRISATSHTQTTATAATEKVKIYI